MDSFEQPYASRHHLDKRLHFLSYLVINSIKKLYSKNVRDRDDKPTTETKGLDWIGTDAALFRLR